MGERRGKRAAARWLSAAIWMWAASALADAEPAAQVEAWLTAGIEPSEARHNILALGPAGELAVIAVFEREAAPRYVRLRALSVLQSFETESATRYFADLVALFQRPSPRFGELHPARSSLVLRRALEGLVPTGQLLSPPLDVEGVAACLGHHDPHVRKAAAAVLATLDDGRSERALSSQLAREKSTMVRGTLQQALTSRSVRRPGPR